MSPDLIERMLSDCEGACGLTKWEEDFVESLRAQFEDHGQLSERQEEILERIYEEKA